MQQDDRLINGARHHTLTKQVVWEDCMESCRLCVWYKMLLFRSDKIESMCRTCAIAVMLLSCIPAGGVPAEAGEAEAAQREPEETPPPLPPAWGGGTVAAAAAAGGGGGADGGAAGSAAPSATGSASTGSGGGGGQSRPAAALAYLPSFYLDAAVDTFNTLVLRRTGDGPDGLPLDLTDGAHIGGLEAAISFLSRSFNSPDVLNADAKDLMLQSISVLLQVRQFI